MLNLHTKKFIVTKSEMVEVVKTWEITVPNNNDAEALAYEIAEECDELGWHEAFRSRKRNNTQGRPTKFDTKHIPCIEDIAQWSIKEQENDQ